MPDPTEPLDPADATRPDGAVAEPDAAAAEPADADALPPERVSPRSVVLSFGMLATAALLSGLVLLPVPYVVTSPGPTRDVLGEYDGRPIIEVAGATTYESTGELRLTTVRATGGPGYPTNALAVLQAWFARSSNVQPREDLYPEQESRQQVEQQNQAQMVSSQENATVAALTELGYEVPATMVVAGAVEGTHAEGVVEKGDVILAIDGTRLTTYNDLVETLAEVEPGATITLTVTRNGAEKDLRVETGERDDGTALIGVYIDPTFEMPVDVTITAEDIGGPSAGTMFALGIVDKLTPQDEADGVDIAGTGTIDVTGAVGPIGGIRQKLAGARRDGATWFLAPEANCGEVVGAVPAGLHVTRIATLHEAREAIEAIGAGRTDDLPTCTAG
ncbi:YlbL family protein [Cellulomonas massiliensis]|uniref:YlbL family protein n=1 Tax=Cellulomonas massiliensis TaxID=1465811 RepID=UPI000378405F|nr:PDZ domain-containing protein [Cellulomonas massiliensis]